MDLRAMRLRLLKRMFFAPEICTGRDSIQRLSCLDPGARVLLLVGGSASRTGVLEKVTSELKEAAKCEVVLLDHGEPTAVSIRALRDRVSDFAPHWIVGVGGGSVLDMAKFVWAQYEHPELEWGGPLAIPPLHAQAHLILAPTTSGSGSESSQAAVLIGNSGRKVSYVSSHWLPDLVILDPALTASMQADLTASTGFDALTHAIESAVSPLSQNMLSSLSGTVVRNILRHLPQAVRDPQNLAAREVLQNSSFLGGLCQSTASTGAAHALSHATSALYGTAHSLATGFYLLPTMRFNQRKNPTVYNQLAMESGMDTAEALIVAIDGLAQEVGLPHRLRDLIGRDPGVEDRKALADSALKDVCIRTNACPLCSAEVEELLQKLG